MIAMQDTDIGYTERELDLGAFLEALNTLFGPLFAVMDGGHFDDLEDELADLGIHSRSLFLRGGSEEMRRDGPWFVDLEEEKIRSHVAELAMAKPCAVFWSCAAGGSVLWQHLRTINQILVPDSRIARNTGEGDRSIYYERVLFRHWDPNVVGTFISKFDGPQLARFFGPGDAIIVNAVNYGGFKRAVRPANLPPTEKGALRIDPETLRSIESGRHDHHVHRISNYLRSAAPDRTRQIPDQELHRLTRSYMQEAKAYGVLSEANIGRWCYMQVVTGGKLKHNPDVISFMTVRDPSFTPDMRVRILLREAQKHARGAS